MAEEKKMRKERIIDIATVVLATCIAIFGIAILVILADTNSRVTELQSSIESEKEITRVVRIIKDGNHELETVSLSRQGWLDYIRTYDEPTVTFGNLDFEEMFNFIPIEYEWDDEVKDFLKKEKTTFATWKETEGYDETLYCGNFILMYKEYRDGIKLLFQNPEDGIEVESEIPGALHPKKVYTFIGGGNNDYDSLYYFVYEDENGNVIAINNQLEAFQLDVPA